MSGAMTASRQCLLDIRAYHTWVNLGTTPAERSQPQEVEFEVRVRFAEEPPATSTDRVEDTICYGSLCTTLETTARAKPYHLIESLGRAVFDALKPCLAPGDRLEVTVHKLRPPIENLRGGARFIYGDVFS
jgi:dihydroneopterin aldolase